MSIVNYTSNERDLLARLMRAEAIGEGELGMLMVGNVGVNRVLANCLTFYDIKSIQNMDLDLTTEQIIDINNETYFNIKNHALKSKQAMELLGKNGFAIVDMFFPNCLYSYHLKDSKLEVTGLCDKIEIVDGKYYPISIKHSTPPIKGVWDQDAIDLAANAILIEEEFETAFKAIYNAFVK